MFRTNRIVHHQEHITSNCITHLGTIVQLSLTALVVVLNKDTKHVAVVSLVFIVPDIVHLVGGINE